MSVLVLGAGRSGTNMVLEALAIHPMLKATKAIEDQKFFIKNEVYPNNYLTKCDTHYVKDLTDLHRTLALNRNLKIIFTIRDPRDMMMSKMRRGVTEKEGGDCKTFSDDATPEGVARDMMQMDYIYDIINRSYPDKIMTVKMEDMILDTQFTIKKICEFLGLEFYSEMLTFYKRMRNNKKRNRYKGIDKSQVGLWKDWENAYDKWFPKKGYDMGKLFEKVTPYVKKYGY